MNAKTICTVHSETSSHNNIIALRFTHCCDKENQYTSCNEDEHYNFSVRASLNSSASYFPQTPPLFVIGCTLIGCTRLIEEHLTRCLAIFECGFK
ncbi:hypothetical protein T06_2168 [Trichinella sp. T6]|nr:hypothetical protein T06_2168 [Trichinella sp. T6]